MKRHTVRLRCSQFYVDVRLVEHDGRWIAVAETPDGPSVGWGAGSINATIMALRPFDGRVEELLRSAVRIEPLEHPRG